jgi:hypothetical protein
MGGNEESGHRKSAAGEQQLWKSAQPGRHNRDRRLDGEARVRLLSASTNRGYVGAFRNLDDDGVIGAGGSVVFVEFFTKSPGLNADNRLDLRVETGPTVENFDTDVGFFDFPAPAVSRCTDNERQESAEARSPAKRRRAQNSRKLIFDALRWHEARS